MSEPVNVRDDRKHTFFIVDNALIEKHGRAIGAFGIALYVALASGCDEAGETGMPLFYAAAMSRMSLRKARMTLADLRRRGLVEFPYGSEAASASTIRLKLARGDTRSACALCGRPDDLTADHIFARALGGGDHFGNLQILCRPCNSRKGVTPVTEWSACAR